MPEFDRTRPNSARVWDYWLDGKDNYAADRDFGDRILRAVPRQRRHVRANRAFLVRVVRYLVGEVGIRQIIDIGAGLPTAPNVHQIAQAIAPKTRVVYVDNDAVVLAHARALLQSTNVDSVSVIEGDLRRPETIVRHLKDAIVLDSEAPTAVLLLAMLMSLTPADRPYEVVGELMDPLPPGSYLAATHTTADLDPLAMDGFVKTAHEAGLVFTPRTHAEVKRFFDGLELVPPGVVPVLTWRPDGPLPRDPRSVYIYGGVGRRGN